MYQHLAFNGKFHVLGEENLVNKSVYITNDLRQRVFQENIDVDTLVAPDNQKPLSVEDVKVVLLRIDSSMPGDEIETFYKLLFQQYGKVTNEHVANWFKNQKVPYHHYVESPI